MNLQEACDRAAELARRSGRRQRVTICPCNMGTPVPSHFTITPVDRAVIERAARL